MHPSSAINSPARWPPPCDLRPTPDHAHVDTSPTSTLRPSPRRRSTVTRPVTSAGEYVRNSLSKAIGHVPGRWSECRVQQTPEALGKPIARLRDWCHYVCGRTRLITSNLHPRWRPSSLSEAPGAPSTPPTRHVMRLDAGRASRWRDGCRRLRIAYLHLHPGNRNVSGGLFASRRARRTRRIIFGTLHAAQRMEC